MVIMTELLIKLFVKDNKNTKDPKVRGAYGKLSGAVGIAINLILCISKFLAGVMTGSITVTADAVNNLSDAGSSIITLFGFKLSEKPADKEHPYGHGRIEYISALTVSIFVIIMGVELLKSSVSKIRTPEAVEFSTVAIVVLVLSILGKLWLALFNWKLGKKINSTATKAVVTDSLSDTASTFVALVSLIISHKTGFNCDGYFGAAVSVLILWSGISLVKETLAPLLGQPPEKEFYEEIEKEIMSYDGIVGVHDLIIHDYGPSRLFASAHAEVPSDVDIMQSHDTVDLIEREIQKKYGMLISIHLDPIVVDDERINELREITQNAVREINPNFSIHDFRVVDGTTHTNLIFDVVLTYDEKRSSAEITRLISEKLSKIDERLFCVITVDYAFD